MLAPEACFTLRRGGTHPLAKQYFTGLEISYSAPVKFIFAVNAAAIFAVLKFKNFSVGGND